MNKYKKLRKEINISQSELAGILGVSQTAISQWETGKYYPDVSTLKALAEIFCVSTDYLLDIDSTTSKAFNEIIVYTRVPAGVEWGNIMDRDGMIEISNSMADDSQEYIGFKCLDNTMAPAILCNDILIIELTDKCQDGELALVQFSGYDAVIRRIYYEKNGILVQPVQADGRGRFFQDKQKEQPRILGVVRELRRPFQ